MSGIFGIFSFDGSPPSNADCDAMARQLERRGPDGTHIWKGDNVVLGHTLLATTPEALVEVLPLTDDASGCTITADVRLDNREELIEELGLTDAERVIGDGELILRAYLRWGEECPAKLLGDFAFAIWDTRQQRLVCARDHMGVRQLVYHHTPGKMFVFATEVEALLAQPQVPRRINEGRIADFLDGLEGIDLTSTFFSEVRRLPPARMLIVGPKGLTVRRYWELTVPGELKLKSDDAYTAAFRQVLTEAVRCRLRAPGAVGAMVSGGLDSSSAAAVAASILGPGKLHTFSAVAPDAAPCNETRAIRSILQRPQFAATTISFANLDPLRDALSHSVEEIDDPFDAQMNLIRAVYIAGRENCVRVMLDGVGGDLAMNAGNRVGQLLRKCQFRRALAEARQESEFWGGHQSPTSLLVKAGWTAFAPKWARKLKQVAQALWTDGRAFNRKSVMSRDFAARSGLRRRRAVYRTHQLGASTTDSSYRLMAITHPHTTAARERYDRVAGRFAIEPRDPFLDIRMLRFCLSLPPEQLRSEGWTKLILRRAMVDLLPDDVVWRRGKDHLGLEFTKALIAGNSNWAERWSGNCGRLERYVSIDRLSPDARDQDPKLFIELFSLNCWLSRRDVPNGEH